MSNTLPNFAQQKNIERFKKKIPSNAKQNIVIYRLPNGSVAVQATSPGKVPGSKAVYENAVMSMVKRFNIRKPRMIHRIRLSMLKTNSILERTYPR